MTSFRRRYQRIYIHFSNKWWVAIAFAAAFLGVGCSFGGVKFWISRAGEDQIAKAAFKVYATSIFSAVYTNWGNLLLGPQMMANLFLTNYTIDFETFARFARPPGYWATSFNYMQAIQFVPYVLEEDRAKYELAAQCAFPGYYIREQLPNKTYIPAKPRAEHFPVYFNEPYQGNQGAMGLDNTATTNRYLAFNKSRQTGDPSLSDRILLVQVGKFGGFILVPIFRDMNHTHMWYPGCSPVTGSFPMLVRNVTKQVFGFINGVIVYQNFFDSTIKPIVQPDIDVFIYDTTNTTNVNISYLGHVPGPFIASDSSHYRFDNTTAMRTIPHTMEATESSNIIVADKQWTIIVGARKGYLAARRTWAPLTLLVISIITTVVPVVIGIIHFILMQGHNDQVGPLDSARHRRIVSVEMFTGSETNSSKSTDG